LLWVHAVDTRHKRTQPTHDVIEGTILHDQHDDVANRIVSRHCTIL
jgi:hypothetical protein